MVGVVVIDDEPTTLLRPYDNGQRLIRRPFLDGEPRSHWLAPD
jgi:hypothetical protein